MQVRSAVMLTLAQVNDFGVVVEDFGGVQVHHAGQQHADDQGAEPVPIA
jgi:hypothetical protein